LFAGALAQGQQAQTLETGSLDGAVVFNPLMTNVVGGSRFWMQGGSVQIHDRLWGGFGVVADLSPLYAARINGSNVGLDLFTATFGPRYTWSPAHRRYALFGEALAGEAHGFHSVFPGSYGAAGSADSWALYVGGGINVHLNEWLSARAFEADWLRTQFPNSASNAQNNLRLGAGLVFRFK
jgi:hypothetical protein